MLENDDRPSMKGMPETSDTPPSPNGHANFPAGNAQLYGVDGEKNKGFGQPDHLYFMKAHPENMANLLAEAVVTQDELELYVNLMTLDQAPWGYKSIPSVMKTRLVGSIGMDGRGRKDAVQVATGPMSIMKKGQSIAAKLFGRSGGSPPGAPTPTGEMGY